MPERKCTRCGYRTDSSDVICIECHEGQTEPCQSNEEKYFRWAYQLMIALAKRCKEDPDSMHKGQDWNGLVGTSYSMYFSQARREAGIDQDEFLDVVRTKIDVTDIYEQHCGEKKS